MKSPRIHRFLRLDWESVAGILAALTALVLHFLHVIDPDVLLVLAVVLLALLLLRATRQESEGNKLFELLQENSALLRRMQSHLAPAETDLIGPAHIREASEKFSRGAEGEMIWFNVCLLMFKPQQLFDLLLGNAIDNSAVERILFVLDPVQQSLWEEHVLPKIQTCDRLGKVVPPVWTKIDESVSIILSKTRSGQGMESLLSFWGEPFMSHIVDRDVPRYIFWVRSHSELIAHLSELVRHHRMRSTG